MAAVPALQWRGWRAPLVQTELGSLSLRAAAQRLSAQKLWDAPARAVDEVRVEYGRLLTDLAYRIGNSALFDSACPTTYDFSKALIAWDALPQLPSAARADAAALVRLTFQTARKHAELVGLDPPPVELRPAVRRAARAASLAGGTTDPDERDAALGKVAEILTALGLYYLPDPPARAVTA